MHLPLFWKSHCASCSPVYVILYHVTGSCKGPIAVRQDTTIKGVSVGGEETKLLQYADDMTAVLADVSSAQALFDLYILEIFKKVSGLTINVTKTEGMWIRSSRINKVKPFGIKWPSEPIKALL